MTIDAFHSHLNGHEWLLVHRPHTWSEIVAAINAVNSGRCRTKVSKERTKQGRLLYSPSKINERLREVFASLGWFERRTAYWVTDDYRLIRRTLPMEASEQKAVIESAGRRAIRSYNQTDFVKERVAVEVQLGKYAFIAYDLFVKHLAFYTQDVIDVGVEILPMKALQEQMSTGVGYYEGALYDLARQGRGVPAVPLVLVGILP